MVATTTTTTTATGTGTGTRPTDGARFAEDTGPQRPAGPPPSLSPQEMARWAWRQLTSMRTALILLFLLALAAVPGSLVPQRNQDPAAVAAFYGQHAGLAVWYERVGLFTVYSSPWFAAVYLLLFTSLVGCIVPRTGIHARALRSRPTVTPRVLARMPAHSTWTTATPPADVLRAAADRLGGRRGWRPGHRLAARPDPLAPVAAERGHLRETGNLLFHVALLVVLAGVAVGSLFGYRGTSIVVVGSGFSNQASRYPDLTTGALRGPDRLPPFTIRLDRFDASFFRSGPQLGTPDDFRGQLTVIDSPDAAPRQATLRLNHPVAVSGAQVSLLGNGYAPVITVRDAAGRVLYSDATVFLPSDAAYSSDGVVKVPDAKPTGLEIVGRFLPTGETGFADSLFPAPDAPQLRMVAYRGTFSAGAGSGSVYVPDQALIDSGTLKSFTTATGQPLTFSLRPGGRFTLPNGAGSVTFDGLQRWANVQVDCDPGAGLVLGGAIAAVVGLCGSLFLRRRRWWVRAGVDGAGRTVVEVAGLDRNDSTDLSEEMADLVDVLQRVAPPDLASSITEGTPA